MSERTLLAQMLWDLKEAGDGLSFSKMAARSGGLVAVSTLHGVMNGRSKELTPATIDGVAQILQISRAQVLAALNNEELSTEENQNEEKEKLWAMYSDIPSQCQKDVMDLLSVLQRNHSISDRRRRHEDRKRVAAESSNRPIRVATPLSQHENYVSGAVNPDEQEPDLPAKRQA